MPKINSQKLIRLFISISLVMLYGTIAIADGRFIDHGDGTITDNQMNLMWSKMDNEGDIGWKNGYRWVKYSFHYSLPEEKHNGWRLPTIDELKSLYLRNNNTKARSTNCGMKVYVVPEISLSCGWVWSSESTKMSAKVFTFYRGAHFSDLKMNKKAHRVLAVRDIK